MRSLCLRVSCRIMAGRFLATVRDRSGHEGSHQERWSDLDHWVAPFGTVYQCLQVLVGFLATNHFESVTHVGPVAMCRLLQYPNASLMDFVAPCRRPPEPTNKHTWINATHGQSNNPSIKSLHVRRWNTLAGVSLASYSQFRPSVPDYLVHVFHVSSCLYAGPWKIHRF